MWSRFVISFAIFPYLRCDDWPSLSISSSLFQLIAFVSQEEDKSRVTQWINKNIVIISDTNKTHQRGLLSSPGLPEPAGEGVFYAHSLCQLAVKYNYRDLVQFLIVHCGADLSSSCLQIIAQDKSDADIEPTDAMFTMVLNTFHEPVEFLKVVLNSGVTQKYEDSSQSRKTFTFGDEQLDGLIMFSY